MRLVLLPHEGHGYRARESVLHTLYEQVRPSSTAFTDTRHALTPVSTMQSLCLAKQPCWALVQYGVCLSCCF